MVRRAYTQRSLIEVLLADSDKLWDPILRQMDAVLDDDDLVDRIAEALARRHPQSRRRGRLGTPAAVVLRMLVLLKDVLARLVALGRERRLIRGRPLRFDTTAVETNIQYPTDATLLAGGVRVLTRSLRRIGERVRERTRSVARRVFEISQLFPASPADVCRHFCTAK